MATSGSLQTNAYTYNSVSSSLIFSWAQTSQDTTNNTTTIYWILSGARKNSSTGASVSGFYETGPVRLTVDGVQWYYFSTAEGSDSSYEDGGENTGGRIEHRDDVVIASGYHTFSHNNDGTRSFSVVLEGECYTHDNDLESPNMSGSSTFYLETINRNYIVYYDKNGGSGSMSSSTATYNTAFMTRQNAFTKIGYTFTGWNENSAGTGVAWNLDTAGVYESGKSCIWTYTYDITLYAVWRANKLTVYYDANGGSIPSDSGKDYKLNSSGVVCINSTDSTYTKYHQDWTYNNAKENGLNNPTSKFGISRTGYTFLGWALNSDETDDFLDPNNVKLKPTDITDDIKDGDCSVTLYAGWRKNVLTIKYHGNGGSIPSTSDYELNGSNLICTRADSEVHTQEWTYNDKHLPYGLNDASTFDLEKEGYTFVGWKVGSNGDEDNPFLQDVTTYVPTDFTDNIKNGDCTITMYAVWRKNLLKVYYHGNGGSISTNDSYKLNSSNKVCNKSDSSEFYEKWYYNDTNSNGLVDNTTFKLTRDGYIFVGWKVGNSGTEVFDMGNENYVPTDFTDAIKNGDCSITMYAVWLTSKIYMMSGGKWVPYLPEGTTSDNINSVYKMSGGKWTKSAQVRKISGGKWTTI